MKYQLSIKNSLNKSEKDFLGVDEQVRSSETLNLPNLEFIFDKFGEMTR